jgi:hypothetical protein
MRSACMAITPMPMPAIDSYCLLAPRQLAERVPA